MNEVILIIIAIFLFFFGYEIRPWIVTKHPEIRHLVDLIVMAVTIATILTPLISLIATGEMVIGSYILISAVFIVYLIYYKNKHREEVKGKSEKVFGNLLYLYISIFVLLAILFALVARFNPNIKL